MILKPKSTVRNPKALVYRRFTQLQDSYSTNTIYKTEDDKFWAFNGNNSTFLEVDSFSGQVVEIETRGTILEYKNTQFFYNEQWVQVEGQADEGATIKTLEKSGVYYGGNRYWYITLTAENEPKVAQVSQSFVGDRQLTNISPFPQVYIMRDIYGGAFWRAYFCLFPIENNGLTNYELKQIDYRSSLETVNYKTQDGKYWHFVNNILEEIAEPQEYVEINNFDIVPRIGVPKNLYCYYDGTQWNYGHGEIASMELPKGYHTSTYYWVYDETKVNNQMVKLPNSYHISNITNFDETDILVGARHSYRYDDGELVIADGIILPNSEFLSAKFGNIARYQTNKYYFVGSFDYMIRGSIEGTTTQHIKGNIMPLTSLNIKYFNDDIELNVDDLVVIEDHLFSVENPETTQKRMPKAFKVHFATLNSIL